jgi:hypothetical protein
MPVTARLSKVFYDRLGEQVANELVEWFNLVDAQYRSDLRELNELNFARFDAKVEQRFAEQDARIERRFAEQAVWIERRFAEQTVWIEQRFAEQNARFEQRFADLEIRIARGFSEQTRFLYVSLVAQIALIAGLYLR